MEQATQCAVKILDANYKKADLQAVVTNCTQLNSIEKNKLLDLLKKFEPLFDGTLGHWRTKPVSFQLMDGVTPTMGELSQYPKYTRRPFWKRFKGSAT